MSARFILHSISILLIVFGSGASKAGLEEQTPSQIREFQVTFFFEPPPQPGSITLVLEPADTQASADSIELPILEPGTYEVELQGSNSWSVSCISSRYWCPEATVTATKENSRVVDIPIFRSVVISGLARSLESEKEGSDLVIQGSLRLTDRLTFPAAFTQTFSFTQRVHITENGYFQLKGPAGTIDLRIAAQGRVPVYVWGLDSTKRKDLGDLKFLRGNSISGFVRDSVTDLPAEGAAVTLRSAGIVADDAAADRTSLMAHKTKTNDRGFFQIGGVPGGVYRLEVIAEKRALRTIEPIEIAEDSETVLDRTVLLSPLLRAEIHLEPRVGPGGKPWSVRLRPRRHRLGGEWETAALSDDTGVALFSDLLPQTYSLEVYDSKNKSRYIMEDAVVEQDEIIYLDVPVVDVRGVVTLNDEPVAATIEIESGSNDKAELHSDADSGEFFGMIRSPEFDLLMVRVLAQDPRFSRRLLMENLTIAQGVLMLDLELIGIDVSGVVVDSKGLPVGGARVAAWAGNSPSADARTDMTGEFTLRALDEGHYELKAKSDAKGDSDLVPLDLRKGSSPSPQRLVLMPRKGLAGILLSASGEPLPGAHIAVTTVGPRPTTDSGETDVEGKFQLQIAAEASHGLFQILAPSQVLWSGCVELNRLAEPPLTLTIPPLPGGRLEIVWKRKAVGPIDTSTVPVVVTSDAGYFTFNEFWNWMGLIGNPEGRDLSMDHWVFPRIAADRQYAVVRTADAPWQIAASLCLVGPSPDLDWVYVSRDGSEVIEIDVSH